MLGGKEYAYGIFWSVPCGPAVRAAVAAAPHHDGRAWGHCVGAAHHAEQFAQRADFPLEPSLFCKAALWCISRILPGRHPRWRTALPAAWRQRSAAVPAFRRQGTALLQAKRCSLSAGVQKRGGRFVPARHRTISQRSCALPTVKRRRDPRVTEVPFRPNGAADTADGWCCVIRDGCPMGGGKVSGGRVRSVILLGPCGCCKPA